MATVVPASFAAPQTERGALDLRALHAAILRNGEHVLKRVSRNALLADYVHVRKGRLP